MAARDDHAAIVRYYDALAPRYDAERFGGSYGRFLDAQERAIIAAMLPQGAQTILDVGCGTGRLSNFATHGCDPSRQSVRIAAARHPQCMFATADARSLPYPSQSFDAAICFHVLMHLDHTAILAVLSEIARVLRPGAILIADIASARRRALFHRPASGWHGDTALTARAFAAMGERAGLKATRFDGIAILPIHRIASGLRAPLVRFDQSLARLFPDFASYIAACFSSCATV